MSNELQLLRGSIKTNISATTNVYDVTGQWLPPGNYYFLINYTSTDCVKGELNCRGFKAEYTFASKDIIKMMQNIDPSGEFTPEEETQSIIDTIMSVINSVDGIEDKKYIEEWLHKMSAGLIGELSSAIDDTTN